MHFGGRSITYPDRRRVLEWTLIISAALLLGNLIVAKSFPNVPAIGPTPGAYSSMAHRITQNPEEANLRAVPGIALFPSVTSKSKRGSLETGIFNVYDYGAVCDDITDNTTAIQSAVNDALALGGRVFFPPCTSSYLVTRSIHITGDALPIKISGIIGTDRANRAKISANFAGPIFNRGSNELGAAQIAIEGLQLVNNHSAGECVRMNGTSQLRISDNRFHCFRSVILRTNTFNSFIENNNVDWTGATEGSIGIYSGGHSTIMNNDVVGFDHGYRLHGPGIAVIGGRTEVNRTGFRVGLTLDGAGSALRESSLVALRGESNTVFMDVEGCAAASFAGLGHQGGPSSPDGDTQKGMRIHYANQCTFAGIHMAGTNAITGIEITDGAKINTTIQDARVEINGGGGTPWTISPAVDPSEIRFHQTNAPPFVFANLGTPANGTGPVYCSDCTVTERCTGGGTGAFAKRLNGTWVCN